MFRPKFYDSVWVRIGHPQNGMASIINLTLPKSVAPWLFDVDPHLQIIYQNASRCQFFHASMYIILHRISNEKTYLIPLNNIKHPTKPIKDPTGAGRPILPRCSSYWSSASQQLPCWPGSVGKTMPFAASPSHHHFDVYPPVIKDSNGNRLFISDFPIETSI